MMTPSRSREQQYARLDPVALGCTVATVLASAIALLEVTSRVGWGEQWHELFTDIYPGYEGTRDPGVGIAWGVVDGFLGGVTVAWLYNRFKRA